MYRVIDVRTGAVVFEGHSHAQAWSILVKSPWLALQS